MSTAIIKSLPIIQYPAAIESEIDQLSMALATIPGLAVYPPRWLAIQLLEGDDMLLSELESQGATAIEELLQTALVRLHIHYGDDLDVAFVDQRYRFVHQLAGKTITRPEISPLTLSDYIDRIATHRWLGIPVFLLLMWLVFKLTTDIASPFVDWIDYVINGPLAHWLLWLCSLLGVGGSWIESLLVDGMLAGVGGVLVFVPVLAALYFALAILEDSGYMARAAFVMDRLMHALGLHGKSFLPMVVGFGCTVPAIYATRTLDSRRDRILTGLLVPFMSCSARLPVYVLIASVFFPAQAGLVIFGLYLLGILVAIGIGVLLRYTLFRNQPTAAFVLELPPYRLPTWRNIWSQMFERTASFIRKAWTIILVTSTIVWLLLAVPVMGTGPFAAVPVDQSAFAALAGTLTPIFRPLGFGSWETSGALITGFVAKEVVVSTLVQTYHLDTSATATPTTVPNFGADMLAIIARFVNTIVDVFRAVPSIIGISNGNPSQDDSVPDGLNLVIQQSFEGSSAGHAGIAALAFLVFVLLYTPCMVATAAARQEFGGRWMWVSVLGQFAIAWLAALLVFQGGLLLGF